MSNLILDNQELSFLNIIVGIADEVASQIGFANNNPVSARALVTMIAGHELHHLKVLKEKYNIG